MLMQHSVVDIEKNSMRKRRVQSCLLLECCCKDDDIDCKKIGVRVPLAIRESKVAVTESCDERLLLQCQMLPDVLDDNGGGLHHGDLRYDDLSYLKHNAGEEMQSGYSECSLDVDPSVSDWKQIGCKKLGYDNEI
jgi:hypothetical protein